MPRVKRPGRWQDLPLVEVVWVDAGINAEHEGDLKHPGSASKFGGLVECSDVGYLIRRDRKEVVLAVGIVREDDVYRHSNTIPRGWVKEIVYLERKQAEA